MASLGRYEVFLNFCGDDTRCGFANSLYCFLENAGISVFIDEKGLLQGETFGTELLQAIEDCKLYITIFSRNYASKHWCLRELVRIVDNTYRPEEDGNKKVILPIFYDVIPDDVKLKTNLYKGAISELEQKMENQKRKFSTEDVEKWKQALQKVDGIQGWERRNYKGDGHLSNSVVDAVTKRLETRQKNVTADFVGMDDQIADINNLLDIDRHNWKIIGIYGISGIGKTTIAKIIYNQLLPQFGKECSFLEAIGVTAEANGLVKFQQQLFSDIYNPKGVRNIGNSDHLINNIRETISKKKVLIVLDDVDKSNQIQELIGTHLFPGTRILITTKDRGVLTNRVFPMIKPYEMEGLNYKDALQLFCKHAFSKNSPAPGYGPLPRDIVHRVGGLPLALQAIGSMLYGQHGKEKWEKLLTDLRKMPNDDVAKKLQLSYDTLSPAQQQIFLDIACFFIGSNKRDPIYMWEDLGFQPDIAIDVLTNRCMIKVLDNDTFWMHNQFRDLGRTIASQEQSRLRAKEDIVRQLGSQEINKSIKALHLGSRKQRRMTVTAQQIERFPNLQLLRLRNITCRGNFAGCLSQLRWIQLRYNYEYCRRPPQFMATNLHLENVVVMYIGGNEWTDNAVRSLIQGARKLKSLALQNAHSLNRTPTFSEQLVLEKLTIYECRCLKAIDGSIGKLRRLTNLSVKSCKALENLPEQIGQLKDLEHLSLRECSMLRELPDSISKLGSLKNLDVSFTSITRLPGSISRLRSLSSLDVSHTKIVKLPRTMSKLSQLHTLDLDGCRQIQELPELPERLTSLKLRSDSLQTIPDLSNLTNLVEVLLSDASELKEESHITQPRDFPRFGRLSQLRKLELCLLNVHATSTKWGSLFALEELTLYGLDFQRLKQLPSNLRVLLLFNIQVEKAEFDGLPQLETLTIERCELVTSISITSSLGKLRETNVDSCNKLVEIHFLGVLESMESLFIDHCKSLERLVCLSEEPGCNEQQAPELTDGRRVSLVSSSLKMLQKLYLSRCPELREIQLFPVLEALRQFSVRECISLKRLGNLSNLKNLKSLDIQVCKNLEAVEGINELEFLHSLHIARCRSMKMIFDTSRSKIPNNCGIIVRDCRNFPNTHSRNVSDWRSYREKILFEESLRSINRERFCHDEYPGVLISDVQKLERCDGNCGCDSDRDGDSGRDGDGNGDKDGDRLRDRLFRHALFSSSFPSLSAAVTQGAVYFAGKSNGASETDPFVLTTPLYYVKGGLFSD